MVNLNPLRKNGETPPAILTSLSAWWMFDNHTFRKIDMLGDWKQAVIDLFTESKYGTLYIRDKPDGGLLFDTGRCYNDTSEELFTKLIAFERTIVKQEQS